MRGSWAAMDLVLWDFIAMTMAAASIGLALPCRWLGMDRRLFLLAASIGLQGASPIRGRWRSVTTTQGGIGGVYEFRADGTAMYRSAALVEMDYRLTGSQLSLGGQAASVGWHDDGRLQINFGNESREDFVRQGAVADAARPLLGEWLGSRTMEGRRLPVTFQFHGNDRALLAVYLRTVTGRYRTAGGAEGAWTMTLPSLPARSIHFDAASGQLTIQAAGGDPHAFVRF